MTISLQNSSDDSYLAASTDPTREAERILAQRVAGLKAEGTCDYSKYTPTSLRNNYKESMNHMKLVCEHSSDDFLPEQQ